MSKPSQFSGWPDGFDPGYGPYRATCERVVDGDTLWAFVDVGLNAFTYLSFKLVNVDAPEVNQGPDWAREWGDETKHKLGELCPAGTRMLLDTTPDPDRLGSYCADIKLEDDTWLNRDLSAWIREQEWFGQYRDYKNN